MPDDEALARAKREPDMQEAFEAWERRDEESSHICGEWTIADVMDNPDNVLSHYHALWQASRAVVRALTRDWWRLAAELLVERKHHENELEATLARTVEEVNRLTNADAENYDLTAEVQTLRAELARTVEERDAAKRTANHWRVKTEEAHLETAEAESRAATLARRAEEVASELIALSERVTAPGKAGEQIRALAARLLGDAATREGAESASSQGVVPSTRVGGTTSPTFPRLRPDPAPEGGDGA